MTVFYTETATCIHCQRDLGTHHIPVRVDLSTDIGISIGTDNIRLLPGAFVEICPRNNGGYHEANTITDIPQSFLDTVLPETRAQQ